MSGAGEPSQVHTSVLPNIKAEDIAEGILLTEDTTEWFKCSQMQFTLPVGLLPLEKGFQVSITDIMGRATPSSKEPLTRL